MVSASLGLCAPHEVGEDERTEGERKEKEKQENERGRGGPWVEVSTQRRQAQAWAQSIMITPADCISHPCYLSTTQYVWIATSASQPNQS